MMNITILKVYHGGESQARKLFPYIVECDVYSPEHAVCTRDLANAFEEDWKVLLKSGISLSKFRVINKLATIHIPHPQREYVQKKAEYAFRQQKPVWYSERFTIEQAGELFRQKAEVDEMRSSSLQLFCQGRLEEFFSLFEKSLSLFKEVQESRDRHIASNFLSAESEIRKTYPLKKDPLNLCVGLGYMHTPEKFSEVPVTVIPLEDRSFTISENLDNLFFSGAPQSEIHKYMVGVAMEGLGWLTRLKVSCKEFHALNLEELLRKGAANFLIT